MVLDNVRKSIFGWARQSTGSFTDGSFDPRGSIHGMKGFHKFDDDENWAQQREPAHLQRNKTERRRLQGLMRSDSSMSKLSTPSIKDGNTLMERVNVWMINEGKRQTFVAVWIFGQCLAFAFAFLHYHFKDNLSGARRTFGHSYATARSGAFVLQIDVAFILLPICRNLISYLRRTPLNSVIPFDKNVTFHKLVAWSMVFWTIVHVVSHMINFGRLSIETGTGFVGFLKTHFTTGPGITGWIMLISFGVIVWFAMEKRRRANFERFWYSHHLFVIFFIGWQLHGMFCLIPPDSGTCSSAAYAVFWKYWLAGGVIYTLERMLREYRARQATYISKVIQHPSRVVELQIKKPAIVTRPGQYIFLNCPEVSYFQWHPFTLSSAPQEGFISVHIRMAGDFTSALATALGCDANQKAGKPVDIKEDEDDDEKSHEVLPPINRPLPRIQIDGPFGSASEDYYKFETIMLCGAGVGVTPFASILKSIWYTYSLPNARKQRLRKVYFFWICRDYESFEWFASLLSAIEEQDSHHFIEIHTYLTYKVKEDEFTNIMVSDVGGERDAVTKLRSPTHYGRPHWDRIFQNVKDKHPDSDVGVFFCGAKALASTLHQACNKFSDPQEDGTHFFFGKENF